jgi:hypothetical protein
VHSCHRVPRHAQQLCAAVVAEGPLAVLLHLTYHCTLLLLWNDHSTLPRSWRCGLLFLVPLHVVVLLAPVVLPSLPFLPLLVTSVVCSLCNVWYVRQLTLPTAAGG